MLYPGCPHIFRGLKYSGASVRGHTCFHVVQCIGLQYSLLIPRANPKRFLEGSGYIFSYIPTRVTIQTFSITTPSLTILETILEELILCIAPTAGQYGKILPSRLSNTGKVNFNIIMFSNCEYTDRLTLGHVKLFDCFLEGQLKHFDAR